MKTITARTAAATAAAGLVWLGALTAQGQDRTVNPGDPLSGISPVEFSEFRLGLEDFTEVETAEDGLGPAFNGTSCAVCHNLPAIGGGGVMLEMRAGYRDESDARRGLNAAGDTLLHMFSTPNHSCQAVMPDDANVVARRAPVPLFGAGLVEAIADETLLALEDPFDRNGDGVSGRAPIIVDVGTGQRRVGRFGWKSQHATLLTFGADAYRNEMGITNDLFPVESAFGVSDSQMRRCDPIPDPEDARDPFTRRRGIDNFEAFMKFLAPMARAPIDDTVRTGERVFAAIGCAACHVPSLTTGPSTHPAFHRRPVPLFSDLLLHDVGTGDGIRQSAAEPEEIRTPALWGLRVRRPLLHDGSAANAEEAIRRHQNEADPARRGYERLSPADHAALAAFLKSL
ncbi:MAG: di-heme oxidoredictase family protein [Acidobacteriota bacterium]